ncbi:hypothetical protein QR98_0099260 [Sarcoptes scabiei]|uniref:Uncharacterized protein n=1 Tax=Sarcoptes scabiei TaxID=52283 RepID=A0A132AL91_SARSC|nr:hypothetical protein QR98_0099260 [Sarcoptes scabiei]
MLQNQPTKSSSKDKENKILFRNLIVQYADDLYNEIKANQSVNFDFILECINKPKSHNDTDYFHDDSDETIYVSKLMAKTKEKLDRLSIMDTAEFRHLVNKANHIMENDAEIIKQIREKIFSFQHKDQI